MSLTDLLRSSLASTDPLTRSEIGFRHLVRLYRNTHNSTGEPDKFPAEDQEQVWSRYGLLGHMLDHRIGKSPQMLYTELEAYRQDFIEEYPQPEDMKELDLSFFFEGLAALLKAGFIRAEVEKVAWPLRPALEKREFNTRQDQS